MEDDTLYDDLSLEDEEDQFGMANDNDKLSSQDDQSIQDEAPDHEPVRNVSAPSAKTKSTTISETTSGVRRPSVQMKSPLPALSTLHASLPGNVNGKAAETMRPAPLPTIPTGQPLKYASAAAAAASSVGIAPLPPPPAAAKASTTASPAPAPAQPVAASPAQPVAAQPVRAAELPSKQPTPAPKEEVKAPTPKAPTPVEQVSSQASKTSSIRPSPQVAQAQPQSTSDTTSKARQPPSPDSGIAGIALSHRDSAQDEEEEESVYHLPSSLTDLLGSFEETKQRAKSDQPFDLNMMNASRVTCPTPLDAEKPNHYKPQNPYAYTPAHYPQEPLGIFDDPRLYSRIDTDSLFYAFYYRQGTYQQYLAAKALKSQSWRFHKQYQTWFQRHEEPKNITEEFEQGTYRFFDYESTW
jgi:CCR4-NOT transcription complex subunit 3